MLLTLALYAALFWLLNRLVQETVLAGLTLLVMAAV